MKTTSGVLKLTKKEREALEVIVSHTKRNINYGSQGTFGDGQNVVEKKDYKLAHIGMEVINFVLQVTS